MRVVAFSKYSVQTSLFFEKMDFFVIKRIKFNVIKSPHDNYALDNGFSN